MTASMRRMTRRASSAMVFASVVVLLLVQGVSAGSQTSTITDPEGDAFFNFNFESPLAAPGYQDIVGASVTQKDGRFVLTLDLAADVPASPILPSGAKLLEWSWRIDTNPATFPTGIPWPPGFTAPAEYMVFVLWDGSAFMGILIDRTPTLTGGQTELSPVSLRIKGAEISASLAATRIGNPPNFGWFSATQVWTADLGTEGFVGLDVAIVPGVVWATWPA